MHWRPSLASARRRAGIGSCLLLVSLATPPGAAAQSKDAPQQIDTRASAPSTSDRKEPQKERKDDPPKDPFGFRWDDHPSLHLGKGTHIDFGARAQADLRRSGASIDTADDSETDLARRRIVVEGEIANVVNFQVERELGSDNPWRDVYANYRQFDVLQVQGGTFKLPFSLDENTSVTNLDFVYRSLAASVLAPGRDRGVMVHGRLHKRVFRYELGVFNHDGRNARSRNTERVFGERAVAGRLIAQPFRLSKSAAADLQIGVAFTTSEVPLGLHSLRGRTTFEETFFDPDLWVQGSRRRTGVEVRWRPGPFSVKSEYIRLTTERRGQSVEDTDLSPLLATGWYVSGSWALTGEKKAAGLDTPRRPFLRGGVGAVEVAFRIETLAFGSIATDEAPSSSPRANVVASGDDRVTTLGVNWYLNRWVKIQVNAIRETITNARRGSLSAGTSVWSQLTQFQFTL
jgi:phosphate-selective porin